MASFTIELNHKPEKGQKEHALFLRITVNRKLSRIKLNYSVKPEQFNVKAKNTNFIRTKHPEHKKINRYLEQKINIAKDAYNNLELEGKVITAQSIKEQLTKSDSTDFLEYFNAHCKILRQNGKAGNLKKYITVYNNLLKFNESDKLPFNRIDKDFLKRFESHLVKDGKVQTTIGGYLNKIRATFNRAIDDGIIQYSDNPFLTYKIKHGTVNKERLTITQIALIENLDLPTNQKIHHVRNAFIFAFYAAGMRVSDVLMLKWRNIVEGRLSYVMNKTKKQHSFTLPKQAVDILNQYEKGKPDDFVFPFMTNRVNLEDPAILHDQIGAKTAYLNKMLKLIAEKAEIDINLTTHTARHSFADYARQNSDNLYNLSKTLGHSSLNVTQAYLAAFDEKAVDETIKSIFNGRIS
jgi:integrase